MSARIFLGKEASGCRLFYYLYGVQVVGGSNPLTPTINWKQEISLSRLSREAKYESVRLRRHGLSWAGTMDDAQINQIGSTTRYIAQISA
jgi:hypothetical protein